MAGTSETLLEARIISTAFGCLSSRSAGGDRSGTNRSSRLGPRVVWGPRWPWAEDSGQPETWEQWDLLLLKVLLSQREGLGHNEGFGNPGSSHINRFQCQTPGSLQVGVLGHAASLGMPALSQLQHSVVLRSQCLSPASPSPLDFAPSPAPLAGIPRVLSQILPWGLELSRWKS